jgi:serine/threonine protein kinase
MKYRITAHAQQLRSKSTKSITKIIMNSENVSLPTRPVPSNILSDGILISARSNCLVRAERRVVTKTHIRLSKSAIMEIPIMLQLSHPNIMYAYDLTVDDRGYVLSMPRADCTLLDSIQSICRFPIARLENLLSQIASGMNYLHQRNILHLDLKSDNIVCFVSEQTIHCKIIDFGTAEYLADRQSMITSILKCTCTHRPPEGYLSSDDELPTTKLTRAFDVWSYGMVALELYSHQPIHKHPEFPVYTGKNDAEYEKEMQSFILSDRFQTIVQEILPKKYWACLNPDPSLRPPICQYASITSEIGMIEDIEENIQLPIELRTYLDNVFEFLVKVCPEYPIIYRQSVERLFHGLLKEDSLNRIEIEETLILSHYFLDERYAILLKLRLRNDNSIPILLRKEATRKIIQLSEGRYALFDN